MKKILIIDDEESVLRSLKLVFGAEGHDVTVLKDSGKAEEMLRAQEYDLLIVDIQMKPLDGMQVLEMARSIRPSMPRMVCSALSYEKIADRLKAIGYDGFIHKPFKIDKAIQDVNEVLNAPR